jgi:hypothetical protein
MAKKKARDPLQVHVHVFIAVSPDGEIGVHTRKTPDGKLDAANGQAAVSDALDELSYNAGNSTTARVTRYDLVQDVPTVPEAMKGTYVPTSRFERLFVPIDKVELSQQQRDGARKLQLVGPTVEKKPAKKTSKKLKPSTPRR